MHVADAEADAGKRPFTRRELIALFDHADEEVSRIHDAGRKGWLPAFRDAVLFKTAYAFGLRRNETRMLDVIDFGRNPQGLEFGECGVLYVRHGKAKKGSRPPCGTTPSASARRATSTPGCRRPISQHRRIALIGKVMSGDNLPLMDRVTAALVLLYAQPIRRLIRLTVHDVLADGDQVALRLGDPPTPVPEPFADRLLDYVRAGRPNRLSGTSPASDWLSPGVKPDDPWTPRPSACDSPLQAYLPSRDGPPPCGNSSSRRHRRSSPECSATTPSTPKPSPPKPGEPGRPTAPGDHSR